MLSFSEYLQKRDPLLYESMLNEVSWQDIKNFGRKATPYLAAAAGTGLAALGAQGVYNSAKGSAPAVQTKQDTTQVAQNAQVSPQSITNIDKQYAPEEILVKKVVIPKDIIRGAQPNQQKWDRDFANLSTDYTGDQGLATRKDNFEKPSLMYVVKKDALQRVRPGSGAYSTQQNGLRYIVLPDTAFESLPTATSNGVPTDWGKSTLAHELRHTTQDFASTPKNRSQGYDAGNHQGSISDPESDLGKHYRNDPVEMGVRLAALKNLVSQENIESIADSIPSATEGIIIKKMLQLANGNEKDLFTLVMSNGALKFAATTNPETKQLFAGIFSPEFDPQNKELKNSIDDSLKTLRDRLGAQNDDADDLLQFYNKIPVEKRGAFFQELIDGYDRVVKSPSSQNRDMA
jgi:hypothetical protein